MSLTFTFDEFKKFTRDVALINDDIAVANDSLLAVQEQRQEALDKDNLNKKFFDNALTIINSFHTELSQYTGINRTLYNETDLINSSNNIDLGPVHFPKTPIWKNIQPKLIDSVNGLPLLTPSPTTEFTKDVYGNQIRNMFTSGFLQNNPDNELIFFNSSLNCLVPPSISVYNDFTVGQKVILFNATQLAYVIITDKQTNASPPEQRVFFKVLIGDTITSNVTTDSDFSGFTETVRKLGPKPDALVRVQNLFVKYLNERITFLNNAINFLNNNPVKGALKTQINDVIANTQTTINGFNNYLALPETVADMSIASRYDNANLTAINTIINNRVNYITNTRVPQLNTIFTPVVQAPNGNYSNGSIYFDLFKWIEARISLANGSLTSYHSKQVAEDAINQKINLLNLQKSDYDQEIIVKKLIVNSPLSAIQFFIENTIGLNVGNSVTILDDNSTLAYTRTITAITPPNTIVVNAPVSQALNVPTAIARVAKEL
jgi:hypothetical protein